MHSQSITKSVSKKAPTIQLLQEIESVLHDEPSLYPLTEELSNLLSDTLQNLSSTVTVKRFRLSSEGRSDLCYEVIGDLSKHKPCLVLANGLGGRLYTWLPVIEAFATEMNIITWGLSRAI